MRAWIVSVGVLLSVLLLLSACGKQEEGASGTASGETKEVTIDAKNFDFDVKEIKVKKGDTVKVTLKNSEGNHAVKFEGYNKEVKGNQTITFVASKTGEFNYICSIFCGDGHNKMTGKLIVE
ncbi:cupredoxin domain-containing protein [Paenibacillus ginsengarvi]|uniref:EfeO-type cupredoxin-like domain-containing protein n=1 Tax=Paenibacillus ginsengarvi TaxID=400777 RepID=A0A3B0CJA0_9BACL|nr:cupredoxin domain-containing protein [Paenibacillus ginsengarvi]RKN85473.1 hypothetical protein D7M11_07215 [Paenibacillus ginsengarvi]